jgi:hypothetical protein
MKIGCLSPSLYHLYVLLLAHALPGDISSGISRSRCFCIAAYLDIDFSIGADIRAYPLIRGLGCSIGRIKRLVIAAIFLRIELDATVTGNFVRPHDVRVVSRNNNNNN